MGHWPWATGSLRCAAGERGSSESGTLASLRAFSIRRARTSCPARRAGPENRLAHTHALHDECRGGAGCPDGRPRRRAGGRGDRRRTPWQARSRRPGPASRPTRSCRTAGPRRGPRGGRTGHNPDRVLLVHNHAGLDEPARAGFDGVAAETVHAGLSERGHAAQEGSVRLPDAGLHIAGVHSRGHVSASVQGGRRRAALRRATVTSDLCNWIATSVPRHERGARGLFFGGKQSQKRRRLRHNVRFGRA
jgi:hypothetical protein